ncbi:hypothetical protein A3J43_00545 [Candidatus Uhrbacteria bacterium RIFCSPHIGHO2_12_FULL_54_23]|uniref:Phage shock protein PspC N-terminal domain-containing protein n=3 Tax=Candidatus Uhriibacteriota TaxID=1752732 RepID=A0A1F7UHV6_9BACT|nr:MAG: hypothetical protein A3J43_00545 [Candidatus Uhrbacteria bacterium RIFCSPHIGHO2_12_FULL_54_23]OGL85257.1 MAG: hypothetical protein A3B36_00135 [Candidatus Uhrbacteria bacterium RIFCSPLOWO2_01_FULL_55_36]OGL89683.1 MAG: hypothetical protein A3J36_01280 [Candidatus Uhrbacteria bacterium RIFCSPLOWO2_02_FULL_54_37]
MKKLYRSRTNKMIAGVCGGLGEYLNIDATIVRLAFVLLTLMSGFGVLLYIVLWIIVPLEGESGSDLNRTHLTDVATEMKKTAQEMAGEVKKTVEEFKKKKNVKKGDEPETPAEEK